MRNLKMLLFYFLLLVNIIIQDEWSFRQLIAEILFTQNIRLKVRMLDCIQYLYSINHNGESI